MPTHNSQIGKIIPEEPNRPSSWHIPNEIGRDTYWHVWRVEPHTSHLSKGRISLPPQVPYHPITRGDCAIAATQSNEMYKNTTSKIKIACPLSAIYSQQSRRSECCHEPGEGASHWVQEGGETLGIGIRPCPKTTEVLYFASLKHPFLRISSYLWPLTVGCHYDQLQLPCLFKGKWTASSVWST